MSTEDATVFVCVSCRREVPGGGGVFEQPGLGLVEGLRAELRARSITHIKVEPVDCLAVCKRPCTVALSGTDKWIYLVGDLDPVEHVAEVASAVEAYARSDNGIVAWKERPQTFRKGVIARVPPLGWKPVQQETK